VLRDGLRELDWVDGQSVVFACRSSGRELDQIAAAAAEPIRLEPDVIVAESAAAAMAFKRLTRTIPIVLILVADPVGDGLVASLARPGGNLTGLTTLRRELGGKRLQLLDARGDGSGSDAENCSTASPVRSNSCSHTSAVSVLSTATCCFRVCRSHPTSVMRSASFPRLRLGSVEPSLEP
jgi:hypothetical protein